MSFDSLAPHYRWMEFVLAGEKLQRCRIAFLDRIANHRDILVLGEGNGRFLSEFVTANQSGRITCIDASAKMLHCAQTRLTRENLPNDRVELMHRDVLDWKPPHQQFDAIVSHFFLDCFTSNQLELIISRIAASAQPGALWLIADFNAPARGFGKWRAKLILSTMYRYFRWATKIPAMNLASPDVPLQQNGFQLRERRLTEWDLLHSDLWQNA